MVNSQLEWRREFFVCHLAYSMGKKVNTQKGKVKKIRGKVDKTHDRLMDLDHI